MSSPYLILLRKSRPAKQRCECTETTPPAGPESTCRLYETGTSGRSLSLLTGVCSAGSNQVHLLKCHSLLLQNTILGYLFVYLLTIFLLGFFDYNKHYILIKWSVLAAYHQMNRQVNKHIVIKTEVNIQMLQ